MRRVRRLGKIRWVPGINANYLSVPASPQERKRRPFLAAPILNDKSREQQARSVINGRVRLDKYSHSHASLYHLLSAFASCVLNSSSSQRVLRTEKRDTRENFYA